MVTTASHPIPPGPASAAIAALEAVVAIAEAKDSYLAGHSSRVATLAAKVAEALGLPPGDVETIRLAGRLHDVGMVGIPEVIVNKQGPLTDQEFAVVKRHADLGAQVLAAVPELAGVADLVRSHHERWDGQGYPDRLAGEAIPLGARILGAVEIYDALTTSRPYQEPMGATHAAARLGDLAGTMLDARVHAALARVVTAAS